MPSVIPGASPQLSDNQNLQGAFPWYAIDIVNPCSIKNDLFENKTPNVIDIVVKGSEADLSLGNDCFAGICSIGCV